MFMHIEGMGDEDTMARGVGQVFGALKQARDHKPVLPRADIDPKRTSLDPKKIDRIICTSGNLKDGVYKIVIGRTARVGDHEVGKEMGVNTWAAFAGSDDRAVVDGDFAMREGELQGVLKAMRAAANINIVAIHNHMTYETPRYVFLHYWGIGPTQDLAKGIRAALDTQKQMMASPQSFGSIPAPCPRRSVLRLVPGYAPRVADERIATFTCHRGEHDIPDTRRIDIFREFACHG